MRSFVVQNHAITCTDAQYTVLRGDILIFDPNNNHQVTVYRGNQLQTTFSLSDSLINNMAAKKWITEIEKDAPQSSPVAEAESQAALSTPPTVEQAEDETISSASEVVETHVDSPSLVEEVKNEVSKVESNVVSSIEATANEIESKSLSLLNDVKSGAKELSSLSRNQLKKIANEIYHLGVGAEHNTSHILSLIEAEISKELI